MTFRSKLGSFAIITITFIYSSKLGKDIWNAKIECRNNINDLNKSIDNINKRI
jgi:hypothetical protein